MLTRLMNDNRRPQPRLKCALDPGMIERGMLSCNNNKSHLIQNWDKKQPPIRRLDEDIQRGYNPCQCIQKDAGLTSEYLEN